MGKVAIVGSYVVDLMSKTKRLPKPGETVLGETFKMGPGGKGGNQATAAAKCGSEVFYLTKVGHDLFGNAAIEHFKSIGLDLSNILVDKKNETGTALITVDENSENNIVVTLGACGLISNDEVEKFSDKIKEADVLLLQLETNIEAIGKAIELAINYDKKIILNPAPYQSFPIKWLKNVSYITPNETEASEISGIHIIDEKTATEAAKKIYALGVEHVIITLGSKGALLYSGDTPYFIKSFKVDALDTTGAGDAFNGGLAHALATNMALKEAIYFANAVAALAVTKIGTAPAMPTKIELEQFLIENNSVQDVSTTT